MLDGDSGLSPATYSPSGVVAGCPIAPSLSKLALHGTCSAVQESGLVSNLDTWIDDISADISANDSEQVASKSIKVFRLLRDNLGQEQLLLSMTKSAFVCSDKETEKRLRRLLRPGEPPILSLVKDLGVDSAGARRRRVASSNCRLAKAQGRSGKLAKLKMQSPAKQAQIAGTGVFTAATFGHQCQGFAPKRMKVLRAIAGNHYGKLSFGSLDLLFDLSETGTGDPLFKLVLEHWKMLQECVERDKPAAGLIRRTWEVTWNKLTRSKQRWSVAAGPIAAMQCYLADMGFDAHSMSEWTRPGCTIALPWGQPGGGQTTGKQLHAALLQDRWQRIAAQEDAQGASDGLDWTVARKMLKESAKKRLFSSGLRMLWQGAIRRAHHGGDLECPKCGQPNTLRHALHDCIRWATVDIGPDPQWELDFPNAPPCFQVRGLVPRLATAHPRLTESQLQSKRSGIFTGEFLPEPDIMYGTDASGGPKGADARLRLVSWAVVAIRKAAPGGANDFEVLGSITGSLQIGATVNEGESAAINELALWVGGPVKVAVDSKVAIKWCHKPQVHLQAPEIWTADQRQRENLELAWTKGHLGKEEHCRRFGPGFEWAWFANKEADLRCNERSANLFSRAQGQITDAVDRATRGRCSWLGQRCAHILQSDPLPAKKDLKFEATPVMNRQARKAEFNHRHALTAATMQQDPVLGHHWVITTSAKNLCIKCQECGLYAQQTDPTATLKMVLSHPCKGRAAKPNPSANIHSSHVIENRGKTWQCTKCASSYSVRVPAKGKLVQPCKGKLTGVRLTKKNKEDKACQGKGSGDLRGFFLAQPTSRCETVEAQVGTPPAPTQLETDRSPTVSHGFNQARGPQPETDSTHKGPPLLTVFFGQGVPAHPSVLPMPKAKPKAKAKPKTSNPSVRSFFVRQ